MGARQPKSPILPPCLSISSHVNHSHPVFLVKRHSSCVRISFEATSIHKFGTLFFALKTLVAYAPKDPESLHLTTLAVIFAPRPGISILHGHCSKSGGGITSGCLLLEMAPVKVFCNAATVYAVPAESGTLAAIP